MSWRVWTPVGTRHKKDVDPRKKYGFFIERHIEDVKQGQKVAPDLVESIVRPTDPVKEWLQRILVNTSQFRPKNH